MWSRVKSDSCVNVLCGCGMLLFVNGWLTVHPLPTAASAYCPLLHLLAHFCVHATCVDLCARKESTNEAGYPA